MRPKSNYIFFIQGGGRVSDSACGAKKLSINLDQRIFSAELQHTAVGRKLVTWATGKERRVLT